MAITGAGTIAIGVGVTVIGVGVTVIGVGVGITGIAIIGVTGKQRCWLQRSPLPRRATLARTGIPEIDGPGCSRAGAVRFRIRIHH